jgi:hypothetical protein
MGSVFGSLGKVRERRATGAVCAAKAKRKVAGFQKRNSIVLVAIALRVRLAALFQTFGG